MGPNNNREVASEKNQKTKAKYICPETLGVDAFTFNWAGALNGLVPPVHLIGKTVKRFPSSTAGCNFFLPTLDINQFFINSDKI